MLPRTRFSQSVKSLYIGKSTVFKIFLLGGVALISSIFIWYTFNVIEKLKRDTRSQVEKYVRMWQLAANTQTSGSELQFIFEEVIVKANFPIIVLDKDRDPIHWRNIRGVLPTDTSAAARQKLSKIAQKMIRDNGEFPLYFGETFVNYLCYGDSDVVSQLRLMPFIEIGIVVAFLVVALIGFQNLRRSEERHIWVGMAKETAHQLGTPISSLMGWLEVMATEHCPTEASDPRALRIRETLADMQADMVRLQKIANRFGLIGSVPELTPEDLNELVADTVDYYRRRLPFEGKGIQLDFVPGPLPQVALNKELLGWALENLLRNALQAVDSKTGNIRILTNVSSNDYALVELADNGIGIPPAAARKIFRPGFTTKKRGWGLGLTLVKRIVEEYHGGRCQLRRSRPGETVFELMLPMAAKRKGGK